MRNFFIIISTIIFSLSSFGQSINKVIPYKDKKRDYFYYQTSYPVNGNRIVSYFTFKDVITVKLYDENLNEIASKDIERQSKGNYSTSYYTTKKYLFVHEKLKKSDVYKRITLNGEMSIKSFTGFAKPNFYVDLQDKNYYYNVSKGEVCFKRVNFETKETITYKVSVTEGEKASVSKYISFEDSESIATVRSISTKKNSRYEVALHNRSGKEIASFNRLTEKGYKSSVYVDNNKDEIFVAGNFKVSPKDDEIKGYESHGKPHPEYTGIYLTTMNTEPAIDAFYNYADFKKLSAQLLKDDREKHLKKFRFCLEKVIVTDKENIVFATIDKDAYEDVFDALDNANRTKHSGQELNYILVFGVDKKGALLWDEVISLDWKNHDKFEVHLPNSYNNLPKSLNIKMENGKISCNYSFADNIHSFELENGKIINKKDTPYVKKENNGDDLVEFQFERSIYWYENFYFSQDGIGEGELQLDKIEFK